ncbi:cationic amino acid transporter, partial [Haematococcus lacustris]
MQSDVAEASGVELKKTLGVFELITMGVGFMCGAGIFVSPGYIAVTLTGPSLFLAYLSAAVSAALSSFCYAEFTVSIPLAGAAYNYIYATLGELIAWITVSNLLFEYILSNAAVARGFSPYLARLFNRPSKYFYRNYKSHIMDAIQCWGIRESASVNNVITSIQITVLVFIIIAGLTKANKANFSPLIKPGASWKNIFNGAAVSYFSFIGFDALATTAEEQRDPSRDMPRGILGA